MMSCNFVTAAQAESYFEHTKDYYTKNQMTGGTAHLQKPMG